MPIALIFIGVVLLIVAIRGTEPEFFALLKQDFTGPGNFLYWVLALYLISAVGYFPPLRKLSNTFLVLVVLALFLSNKGFFAKFTDALKGTSSGPHVRDLAGPMTGKKLGTTLGDALKNIGGGILK